MFDCTKHTWQRFLPLLALVVLLGAQACDDGKTQTSTPPSSSKTTPTPSTKTTPPPTTPTPAATSKPSGEPSSQAIKGKLPAVEPLAYKDLRELPPMKLTKGTVTVSDTLVKKGAFAVHSAGGTPPRALLAHGEKMPDIAWSIHDLSTGKTVSSIPRPGLIDLEMGYARVQQNGKKSSELWNTTTGKNTTPTLVLPGGAKALETSFWFGKEVWFFAKTKDKIYTGVTGQDVPKTLTLKTELLAWPEQVFIHPDGGWMDVIVSSGAPAGVPTVYETCVRWRLFTDKEPACQSYGRIPSPTEQIPPTWGTYWLDDHWVWYHPSPFAPGYLVNTVQKKGFDLLPQNCEQEIHATTFSPPRVLASCKPKAGDKERTLYLWSPKKVWSWKEPHTGKEKQIRPFGRAYRPVLSGLEPPEFNQPSATWINLKGGTIWKGKPLYPITFSLHHEKTIAWRGKELDRELVVVDFAAGTVQKIGEYKDCLDLLIEPERKDDRIVMVCRIQEDRNRLEFDHRWTEVIDLKAKKRWRTKYYAEKLLPDGNLLVSDRLKVSVAKITPAEKLFTAKLE